MVPPSRSTPTRAASRATPVGGSTACCGRTTGRSARKDTATESVARSVVVRHKHPGQRYAPRELVAYLKGGPRTTEVPTTWPSKGTGGCPEADRPAAVVPESRRGEDTVAPTPRPRLA